MRKLFIIGNGFDLAHELPTKYEDFHKYLKENFKIDESGFLEIPQGTVMPDGDIKFDDDIVVNLLCSIISTTEGNKWCDIETSLGMLDYHEVLDYVNFEFDNNDDDDLWRKSRNMEDAASNLVEPMKSIKDRFSNWINSIKIDKSIKPLEKFNNNINKNNDLFLTFNYTDTLEKVYKIKNVYHIHGTIEEEIIFGHGNDNDNFNKYQIDYLGSESYLMNIHIDLRKDTKKAFKNTKEFFLKLENGVNSIYSFGFSFSEVDQVYIRKICSILNTKNITWYLNQFHEDSKLKKFISIIKKCGFKGKFEYYNI